MPPQQNDELPGVRRFTEVDDRLSGNLNLLDRFILHFVASTDVQILCCESTPNSSRHNAPYRAWCLRTFGKGVCVFSDSEGRIGEDGRGAAATRLVSCHVKNAGMSRRHRRVQAGEKCSSCRGMCKFCNDAVPIESKRDASFLA